MAGLLMVNPRKRRTSKRRTPAQRAATRKLVAANKRRRSPARRASTYSAPARRRRRNPIGPRGLTGKFMTAGKNGAIGSIGAIAGSIVGGFLPIPENLKIGKMGMITHAIIGIGTGLAVSKFANRKMGEQMAQGAVTVALHGTMKDLLQGAVPSLNLGGYDSLLGYDDYQDMSAYSNYSGGGMNAYENAGGMGYSGAGYTGSGDYDDLNY